MRTREPDVFGGAAQDGVDRVLQMFEGGAESYSPQDSFQTHKMIK